MFPRRQVSLTELGIVHELNFTFVILKCSKHCMVKTWARLILQNTAFKLWELTGMGDPKAATEKEGLFAGNENGCGRDSDNGINNCGRDVFEPPDAEASVVGNGSPNIDVFGLLLIPGVENKAGVEVLIESDLLLSCLSVWTMDRSSSYKGWMQKHFRIPLAW